MLRNVIFVLAIVSGGSVLLASSSSAAEWDRPTLGAMPIYAVLENRYEHTDEHGRAVWYVVENPDLLLLRLEATNAGPRPIFLPGWRPNAWSPDIEISIIRTGAPSPGDFSFSVVGSKQVVAGEHEPLWSEVSEVAAVASDPPAKLDPMTGFGWLLRLGAGPGATQALPDGRYEITVRWDLSGYDLNLAPASRPSREETVILVVASAASDDWEIAAAHLSRARWLVDQERPEEALRELEMATIRAPDSVSAWSHLCNYAETMGAYETAVNAARQTTRLISSDKYSAADRKWSSYFNLDAARDTVERLEGLLRGPEGEAP